MPLYKFQQNDIFHNRIEAHPQCNFFIYSGSIYYNNRPSFHGAFTSTKATADLIVEGNSTPDIGVADGLDNDTITLTDAEGNEVTFKFDKSVTTIDGSVGSSGNVIVGISDVTSRAQVMIQLRGAINSVTGYDQSADAGSSTNYTLNITAARIQGGPILVLRQDTAGTAGNTSITINSPGINSKISGPTKFTGGNLASDQGGLSAGGVPAGYVSLYGLNIDRVSGSSLTQRVVAANMQPVKSPDIIYPFIIKDGSYTDFKETRITTLDGRGVPTIDTLDPGDIVTGSYSLSASITKEYFAADHVHRASIDLRDAFSTEALVPNTNNLGISVKSSMGSKIVALQNTLDSYINLSHHYAYSSASLAVESNSVASWSKAEQELGLISIPSIFYDSSIQKGTVNLKFYITGTLVGELKDERENGELIQVGPSGSYESGSVAGVVLYNEGFVLLTGSWDLTKAGYAFGPAHTEWYLGSPNTKSSPRWIDFAQTIATGSVDTPQSSYELDFKGTSYVPTMTMLAHARKGHLNHSNNPTYIKHGQTLTAITSSRKFRENTELEIKNTISSSHLGHSASFKRQTYISKIGIYDEKKNLIGIAKVATPVKKTEERDFTFKLKLDF
tara:strand:+ start:188 stop:2035 length:1848 start_codon:yes stop_codon:yes gene_type:complete